MTIELYKSKSDTKRMVKDIELIESLDGNFRNESSQIKPVIRVNRSESAKLINYFFIPIWNRYYFVTDIVRIRDGIIEIHGRCDVLTSSVNFGITSCKGVVARSATKWNLYLDDGSLKVYSNKRVVTQAFPSGFNTQEMVLAVAG